MPKMPFSLHARLKERFSALTGPNSAVILLIAAAVGTVVFTVLAGALVYGTTRALISSSEWVQHTQDVLASLQRASLLTERIEYRSRLYTLTRNEEQLTRAQASDTQLETTLVHLKTLVADSTYQTANLQQLSACRQQLHQAVSTVPMQSEISPALVQQCQKTISLMLDHELLLLQERSHGSERNSLASIGTEIGLVVLFLIVLVVLFRFLVRDAIDRRKSSVEVRLANDRLASTVKALEDRAGESELLTTARDELQLCVDVQQIYRSAARGFSRLLPGTNGSLCIINNSRQMVEVVSSWQNREGEWGIEDFSPPDCCCGLRSGQPRWRRPGVSEIHCTHFRAEAPERYLCHSFAAHGNTLGMLYVECASDDEVAAVNQRMDGLRQLLQLTGMAIASLNLRTKLENQSMRDGLTGLFNRHFMQISLEREIARAARRKQTLAVFMLDLDHFKNFNDTYGHGAGDTVLQAAAEVFRSRIRTEDIACRYGGEEFTIILPDMSPGIARDRAENIRRAIADLRVPLDGDVAAEVTVSVGVAVYPGDGNTAEGLLRQADIALYRAKRLGRNQVVQFESAMVTT